LLFKAPRAVVKIGSSIKPNHHGQVDTVKIFEILCRTHFKIV
jgi:hypothetical protein